MALLFVLFSFVSFRSVSFCFVVYNSILFNLISFTSFYYALLLLLLLPFRPIYPLALLALVLPHPLPDHKIASSLVQKFLRLFLCLFSFPFECYTKSLIGASVVSQTITFPTSFRNQPFIFFQCALNHPLGLNLGSS